MTNLAPITPVGTAANNSEVHFFALAKNNAVAQGNEEECNRLQEQAKKILHQIIRQVAGAAGITLIVPLISLVGLSLTRDEINKLREANTQEEFAERFGTLISTVFLTNVVNTLTGVAAIANLWRLKSKLLSSLEKIFRLHAQMFELKCSGAAKPLPRSVPQESREKDTGDAKRSLQPETAPLLQPLAPAPQPQSPGLSDTLNWAFTPPAPLTPDQLTARGITAYAVEDLKKKGVQMLAADGAATIAFGAYLFWPVVVGGGLMATSAYATGKGSFKDTAPQDVYENLDINGSKVTLTKTLATASGAFHASDGADKASPMTAVYLGSDGKAYVAIPTNAPDELSYRDFAKFDNDGDPATTQFKDKAITVIAVVRDEQGNLTGATRILSPAAPPKRFTLADK